MKNMAKKRNGRKTVKNERKIKAKKTKKKTLKPPVKKAKHHPHIEKLVQKANAIKNHIHKVKNDLQSKVRLSQLEDRINRIKEKYNGKYRKEIIGKI